MEGDGGTKSKLIADVDWIQAEELPRPFDTVCGELAALGALSIEDYLSNTPTTSAAYDISFHLQLPPELPASPEKDNDQEKEKEKEGNAKDEIKDEEGQEGRKHASGNGCVAQLRHTCLNMFGSSECLSWEYLEESDPPSKQCILTITRPTGATRSYKSDPGFTRRVDARSQAAQIAIEMGAIDFIVSGDSDALKARKGLLLNPFDVEVDASEVLEGATPGPIPKWSVGEEPLKAIEDCSKEWRAGRVKVHWVPYNEPKNKKKHGAAVRISLNAHVFRCYSVEPVHNSAKQARIACARTAINEGVIDFIKYGNGQTEPTKILDADLEDVHDTSRDTPPPNLKGVTLQEFYETLPRPFPEDVGEVPAAEINAPAWLNVIIQSARGGRLVSKFTPVIDNVHHLHGSILRIERPEEVRTYLVDPQFPKRSDAKAAVCLLAMSQGVGDYIRGLKEAAENKLPADKRKLANEKILQVLSSECGKVRQNNRLVFVFSSERDAFGCTVKADISPDADQPDIREYSVKTEYRTKADAKAAVACHAAEEGLVDLLRFKGGPLPADYVPFWEAQLSADGDNYIPKRKEPERDLDGEGRDRKKRKKGSGNGSDGDPPQRKSKLPFVEHLPPKPVTVMPPLRFTPNSSWKGPRATGPRGLGPINDFAPASRSVGQDRSGNRSGGISHHPQSYPSPSASSPPVARNPHPRMHGHARPYDDQKNYRPDSGYAGAHSGYGHTDHFGHACPSYPPQPAPSHYPAGNYHSPPPPPAHAPPPPPQHYPGYYGTPSAAPSSLPPTSYGHYAYSPHYPPPQYPHAPSYPGPYSPHPPVMYSPPHPPSHSMPHGHSPHSVGGPRDSYTYPPSGYHQPPYPPGTPPPPPSPPRYSHHVSYPSHPISPGAYESGRKVTNRRRHSTVADFRNRDGRAAPAIIQGPDNDSHYHGKTSPPPVAPNTTPDEGLLGSDKQPNSQTTLSEHEKPPVKSDGVPPPVRTESLNTSIKDSKKIVVDQPSLSALYEFCTQQNVAKPDFFHKVIEGKDGTKTYAVWAEKDSQRLELPNQFPSVEEGYEKLSKRVLTWERSKLKQS